jgi:hypothetical protein
MASTKIGHGLAKGLGIKLQYRNEVDEEIRRGESVFSIQTADTYVEQEPTAVEWMHDTLPNGHDLARYARSLFPFLSWIGFYNLQWLLGDLVAGECMFCASYIFISLHIFTSYSGYMHSSYLCIFIPHHGCTCIPSYIFMCPGVSYIFMYRHVSSYTSLDLYILSYTFIPSYTITFIHLISIPANHPRHHHWRRRRPAGYGLCHPRRPPCAVRPLLLLHGRFDLLVLRYLQGHHHRRKPLESPLPHR